MALIKRIKNISGITKQILNRDIAHNAYYEIPETLWQELANDQNIKTDISNGNLIVNDGVSDLNINEALRYVVQFQEVDAYEVNFDNTASGLIAENVQTALDEVQDNIDNITNTLEGKIIEFAFYGNGTTKNKWLELFASQKSSDDTTSPVPFNCKLLAISYGNNKSNTSSKIRITKNSDSSSNYLYEWIVSSKKFAYKSDLSELNLSYAAGDRIRIYAKEHGSTDPQDLHIIVFLQITNNIVGEGGLSSGD